MILTKRQKDIIIEALELLWVETEDDYTTLSELFTEGKDIGYAHYGPKALEEIKTLILYLDKEIL